MSQERQGSPISSMLRSFSGSKSTAREGHQANTRSQLGDTIDFSSNGAGGDVTSSSDATAIEEKRGKYLKEEIPLAQRTPVTFSPLSMLGMKGETGEIRPQAASEGGNRQNSSLTNVLDELLDELGDAYK